MKQIRMMAAVALAAVAIGFTACEWDFGSTADQTSGTEAWVNFTGVYRGDPLVANHSRVGDFQIFSFTILQEDNILRFIDNNASVYNGTLGNVRGTGGGNGTVQYTVRGRNHNSGFEITMVGVLTATDGGGTRTIAGTWLEEGGRTGDIQGQAD